MNKVFKTLVWVIASILMLFIVLLLLIRLPAVQNYVVDKVTVFISSKTGTKVSVGNIYIGFPSTVIIHEIYLEDLKKDTLLYAREIKAGVGLLGLIKGSISLGDVSLTEVTANIFKNSTDSTFNFDFLIQAFVPANKTAVKDTVKKPLNLTADQIEFTNIKFAFRDDVSGLILKSYVGEIVIPVNEMTLDSLIFHAGDIEISNTRVEFVQFLKTEDDTSVSVGPAPIFTAQQLSIHNSVFHMINKIDSSGIFVKSGDFNITDAVCNLKTNSISANQINLDQSSFMNFDRKAPVVKNARDKKPITDSESIIPFKIDVNHLKINESLFVIKGYDTIAKPEFNPENMSLVISNLEIKNIYHQNGIAGISILNAKVADRSGLSISKLHGDFKTTPSMFSVSDLELKTKNSEVNGLIKGRYKNLQMLIDDPGKTIVNIQLNNSIIVLEDLLLLKNDLSKQEIINKNRHRKFVVNLFADGSLDNINLKDLSVQAGNATFLKISGLISGLPDADKLFLDINANRITTTAADIQSLISLPQTINIPENIALSGKFTGTTKTFAYKLFAGTNRGSIVAAGSFYNLNVSDPGYKLTAELNRLDVGYMLKNELVGKINLSANVSGMGFKPETMVAVFNVKSDSVSVRNYEYKNIEFNGSAQSGTISFIGKIADKNLVVDLRADLGIVKEKEFYKAEIKLQGIDLEALHFSSDELRASGTGIIDLKGNNMSTLNGKFEIKDVLIVKNGRNYPIESLAVLNINESGNKSVSLESSLLTAKFNGSVSIAETGKQLGLFMGKYFSTDSATVPYVNGNQNFGFSVLVKNAPVISEVFVPGLESFIPGPIIGSFNSAESKLDINVQFPQVVYKGIRIDSLSVKVDSDEKNLNLHASLTRLSVGDVSLARTDFLAIASENKINAGIVVATDDKVKLKMQALITQGDVKGKLKIAIIENKIILNNQNWLVPDDNFVQIGGLYPEFHNFSLTHDNESISVDKPLLSTGDGIGIAFKNFKLDVLSEIIERDSTLIDGNVNGQFDLVMEKEGRGIVANINLDKFSFKGIPVGDFVLNAKSEGKSKYLLDLKLSGNNNDVSVNGFYIADSTGGKISTEININKLNIQSVEPFSNGQISRSRGSLSGQLVIEGALPVPEVTGDIAFADAGFNVTYLNNYFLLKNENLKIKNKIIYLDAFTITDSLNHTAILNGGIKISDINNPEFNIDLKTDRFLAMNTQAKDNNLFFGTLIISSDIKIRGNGVLPVITSNVKLLEGSSFTFIVPESVSTTERGEEDVKFTDPYNRVNSIMKKESEADTFKTKITGFDLAANVEITKETTLRILVDRESGDSLVIKGDATMSFSIDPSGKTSLTGGFEISEGSYRVSLQNLVKRNFAITKGSSLNWRGDIMDAEINIDAINVVNAVPLELVADQVAGLSEQQINAYRQRLPFQVILHMKGELIKPDISFEISLPPEDQGVLNGTVFAKLTLLNQDPSELNKQVFALLVLNRFVQSNPLDNSSGGGVAYVARNSVSKFLSQQLNSFAEQFIKGVELNFNVQSYEEYATGSVEGRTEVNIGVKKRLFKNRLIVEVAGNVDVEGERTEQNDLSNLAGDVVLEYLLTEDGRYRFSVFRKDQYAGILDGQVTEAGLGLVYTRDFDTWNQFFRKPKTPKPFGL